MDMITVAERRISRWRKGPWHIVADAVDGGAADTLCGVEIWTSSWDWFVTGRSEAEMRGSYTRLCKKCWKEDRTK